MGNYKYEDLEQWEQAFTDLNKKVGNEVWGARLEGSGQGGKFRLRIFINNMEVKAQVLKETNGVLGGHPLVFTLYTQESHSQRMLGRALKKTVIRKKVKDLAENPIEIEIDVGEYDK